MRRLLPSLAAWAAACAACGSNHGTGPGIDAPGSGTADAPGAGAPDAMPGPPAMIHLIGRFTTDANPKFEWPGSEIDTTVDGTSLTLRLDDTGNNRYDVWVDGAMVAPIVGKAGQNDYTVASGLAAGPHAVRIARRTESFFGATTFLGFPNATLVATPGPSRWIELVGDSITCGYGVLGPDQSSCFSDDTEAETRGWAELASAQLGAAHATIAWSGKGMVRNGDGSTTDLIPSLYDRTIADDPTSAWGFTAYTPDVVVIDLGTNDFAMGDPGAGFVTGYEAFVTKLRTHYPSAWIFVAQSPMLSDGYPAGAMTRTKAMTYLSQVAADFNAKGDKRVVYVDIDEQDGATNGYACDYHPSAKTHALMATQLVDAIKTNVGW